MRHFDVQDPLQPMQPSPPTQARPLDVGGRDHLLPEDLLGDAIAFTLAEPGARPARPVLVWSRPH